MKAEHSQPLPDLSEHIGEVAQSWLFKKGALVDSRLRLTGREAIALLAQHGLTAPPHVLAFDAVYGGIIGPKGPFIGVGSVLSRKSGYIVRESAEGDPVVPVGAQGDFLWYLNEAGEGLVHDIMSGEAPQPFADSADVMVARYLLFDRVFALRMSGQARNLDGHQGARLAANAGLPAIAEASDSLGRFWGDRESLIMETDWPGQEPVTTVAGELASLLDED